MMMMSEWGTPIESRIIARERLNFQVSKAFEEKHHVGLHFKVSLVVCLGMRFSHSCMLGYVLG